MVKKLQHKYIYDIEIFYDISEYFCRLFSQRLQCNSQLWSLQDEIRRLVHYISRISWPDGVIAEKNGKAAMSYLHNIFAFSRACRHWKVGDEPQKVHLTMRSMNFCDRFELHACKASWKSNRGNFRMEFRILTKFAMHVIDKHFSYIETSSLIAIFVTEITDRVITCPHR